MNKTYDIIYVGAGPATLYSVYYLLHKCKENNQEIPSILVIEKGAPLNLRKCPSSNGKCVNCSTCFIMSGFGGAGAFSDGKFNITNQFGGNLCSYIEDLESISIQRYIDSVNRDLLNGDVPELYSSSNLTEVFKDQSDLRLCDAYVRHLGTDKNFELLSRLYSILSKDVEFMFFTEFQNFERVENTYCVYTVNESFTCKHLILAVGRSGSQLIQELCDNNNIKYSSNKVDIGVRVEVPYETTKVLTDNAYEAKILYTTRNYQDVVRTFCMNPKGSVVTENYDGIVTVNGHSYENTKLQTDNTNFALLVNQSFTEPFDSSNEYGSAIAMLANMLGKGILVQRLGDLKLHRRSTEERLRNNTVTPTLKAAPGDLSLVLPKRILDDILDMLEAMNNICPGISSDDILLYGVEVKFYNIIVEPNSYSTYNNLYIIGDGSGITHSLSQASAHGVHIANTIFNNLC